MFGCLTRSMAPGASRGMAGKTQERLATSWSFLRRHGFEVGRKVVAGWMHPRGTFFSAVLGTHGADTPANQGQAHRHSPAGTGAAPGAAATPVGASFPAAHMHAASRNRAPSSFRLREALPILRLLQQVTFAGAATSYMTPPSPAVHSPMRPPPSSCFGSLPPAWKHKVTAEATREGSERLAPGPSRCLEQCSRPVGSYAPEARRWCSAPR